MLMMMMMMQKRNYTAYLSRVVNECTEFSRIIPVIACAEPIKLNILSTLFIVIILVFIWNWNHKIQIELKFSNAFETGDWRTYLRITQLRLSKNGNVGCLRRFAVDSSSFLCLFGDSPFLYIPLCQPESSFIWIHLFAHNWDSGNTFRLHTPI